MEPDAGFSKEPMSNRGRVNLTPPDGPTIAMNSPGAIESEILLRTGGPFFLQRMETLGIRVRGRPVFKGSDSGVARRMGSKADTAGRWIAVPCRPAPSYES